MRKKTMILLFLVLALFLSACGKKEEIQEETDTQDTVEETVEESSEQSEEKTLVVYFSATGTTKSVAEKIASITGSDLYEIVAAEPYSDADLNWHDQNSRSTLEQNDPSARPEIAGNDLSIDGYNRIFIGFPIWWGEEPRIMDTFVESHDLKDIEMIPFCTSSSSGIGRSGKNMEENAGSGNWLEGKRFAASVSDDDLRSWIESFDR